MVFIHINVEHKSCEHLNKIYRNAGRRDTISGHYPVDNYIIISIAKTIVHDLYMQMGPLHNILSCMTTASSFYNHNSQQSRAKNHKAGASLVKTGHWMTTTYDCERIPGPRPLSSRPRTVVRPSADRACGDMNVYIHC